MLNSKQLLTTAVLGALTAGGLIGCGHDRDAVPADAVILEADKGVSTDKMSATIHDPGMVYVYDDSDKRVIYTGRVKDGDSIRVNTFKDEISIDGKVVAQPEMDDAHRYRIYFDEDRDARHATGDETYRREVRTEERTVAPAPAPAPQYNPDGTVIRRETTETQVAPAPAPRSDGTVIRKETTETQVPAGSTVTPAPAPTNPDGTVIHKETETQTEIRRD